MKRTITAFAMASLLFPNMISAESVLTEEATTADLLLEAQQEELDEETMSIILNDLSKPMQLIGESYNGYSIVRDFVILETEETYTHIIEVPSSITEQIKPTDENALAEATALLAQYYAHDSINNINRLNEVFLSEVAELPFSEISVSEEYAPTFAENLKYALDSITEGKEIEIPEDEKELLTSYYNAVPTYDTKEKLFSASEELYKELRIKWYEKTSSYVVIGAVLFISIATFIVYKRR